MAFPITVALGTCSAERPGTYGPFLVGSNLYLILVTTVTGNKFLSAYKSTDNGATWAEMDAADRPAADASANLPVSYTCAQSSTNTNQIYSVYVNSGVTTITMFDANTDTWGAPLATTTPPAGVAAVRSMNGFYCAAYRPSDNSVVVVLPGQTVTHNGVLHIIPAFAVFDILSATFSAWTALGNSDYSGGLIVDWTLVPVGIVLGSDGKLRVFTQQISHEDSNPPDIRTFSASTTLVIPGDCVQLANIQCTGAGGGESPGTIPDDQRGGGGGGAFSQLNALTVAPGDNITISIGLGGAENVPGGDTFVKDSGTVFAQGGQVGVTTVGGLGGDAAAGIGDTKFSGGKGGNGNHSNGAGGGGSAFTGGPDGDPGQDGQIIGGGLGGNGAGSGGNGGDIGAEGNNGNAPGGGSGGAGAGPVSHTRHGADGFVTLQVVHTRDVADGRLFQQAINADNSLGTLAEIPEGAFPIQAQLQPVIPFSFDAKAGAGFVAICMTGVNATTNDNILSGVGNNADPIVFSLASFSAGNGGNGLDASPCLAVNGAQVFTFYRSTAAPPVATFRYRINGGAVVDFGTFADGFCRLVGTFLGRPMISFGTPSTAVVDANAPG